MGVRTWVATLQWLIDVAKLLDEDILNNKKRGKSVLCTVCVFLGNQEKRKRGGGGDRRQHNLKI